jgi:glucose/arabinose dehydrogenase
VSCEELNIIQAGENYGWPDVGEFPYADCSAGEGTLPIYNFAREGMEPEDFVSLVEVSGLAFSTAEAYPVVGDSLFVCESWQSPDRDGNRQSGFLRQLVLAEPGFDSVTSSDAIVRDCRGDVSASPEGVIYYATETEIKRLTGGQTTGEAPPPLEAP